MPESRFVHGMYLARIVLVLLLAGCGPEKTQLSDEPAPGKAAATVTPKIITTGVGMTMAALPAGEFIMGDDNGEDDERPAHSVEVDAFYIDVHEVTQQMYEDLMGQNPSKFKNPEHPVEQVGWYGAIKFCNMRSHREGLTPCYDLETMVCDFDADGYRLPTEAEWEYACRAGTTSPYSFGEIASKLANYAWFETNADKTTHPVGQKPPNQWSLHDMHGNVWEWCNDFYDESFYEKSDNQSPVNLDPGAERVLRGGGWNSPDDECRSSARYSEEPGFADTCFGYDAYGFRCVRRVPQEDVSGRIEDRESTAP